MWNIGLDSQRAFCVCLLRTSNGFFLCHLIVIVCEGASVCPPRLELYCISITLYMCVFIPPALAPLLHWDPSGQTIAQQGAFTPICHRLSPFVLPDKQNAGSRLPPLSHLAVVTHGISCSLLLMGSILAGSPFFYILNYSAPRCSPGWTGA